jgi:hypothetical protein
MQFFRYNSKPSYRSDAISKKPRNTMFAPSNASTTVRFPCLEAIWPSETSEQEKLLVVARLLRLGLNDRNARRSSPSKKRQRSARKQAAVA